jgi:peptidyl-prolyl cis-trans isomerase B (cyclophilin B)
MKLVRWGVLVMASVALTACGGAPVKTDQTGARTVDEPAAVSAPDKTSSTGATTMERPAGTSEAVIETNQGTIVFKFFPEAAPKTVENFITLAKKGFYDGLKFHRVVPGFVIQGGDPKGDGTGGPGYSIKAEFNSHPHLDGSVAMARSADPDSAGSQFYICLGPQPFLDGKYTVFGQVTSGLDVVHKIRMGDTMTKVTVR